MRHSQRLAPLVFALCGAGSGEAAGWFSGAEMSYGGGFTRARVFRNSGAWSSLERGYLLYIIHLLRN